jgi:ribosomal-protein-alanine N-acetyltransferase
MMNTIETERLILRKFTIEDAQDAFEMNSDPEVLKYIPADPAKSVEETRELIKRTTLADYKTHGFGRHAIVLKSTGKLIGFTGLKQEDNIDGVELGYRLNRSFWGQGLGFEAAEPFIKIAFEEMNTPILYGSAMKENVASIKILKRLGMTFRREELFMGENFDILAIDNPHY